MDERDGRFAEVGRPIVQFIPREPQQLAIPFLLDNERCNLFASMGMGKSVAAATALDYMLTVGDGSPALIMAPLRVARMAWPSDIDKWDHLSNLSYTVICGDLKEREAALLKLPHSKVAITNYEQLPWLVERLGKKWPFKTYIADESTRLKSYRCKGGSKRAKAIAKKAFAKGSRWVNMTGTPTPNGVVDLWGQNFFVDHGKALGETFTSFQQRWFMCRPGDPFHTLIPLPHAAAEIQERMAEVSLVLRAEDYFDLPPIIYNTVSVSLPKRARKLYDQMEEEFFIDIDGRSIDAVSAGSKSMKLRQLASGSVYDATGKWTHVHDEKIDALKSVIAEACGMPVLVVYYFKSDLDKLTKAFPQGRVMGKDQKSIDDWNAGKVPIMFISAQSTSHGISLQWGSNIMAFYSVDFNSEYHDQVIERLGPMRQYQAGLNRKVFIHYILAENTVDQHVFDVVTGKKTLQEAFKQALLDFRAKKKVDGSPKK